MAKIIKIILFVLLCGSVKAQFPGCGNFYPYPCSKGGDTSYYASTDKALLVIQQDTINAILRRILHLPAQVVTGNCGFPVYYPCSPTGDTSYYTDLDLAELYVSDDTTIALLRKLSGSGGAITGTLTPPYFTFGSTASSIASGIGFSYVPGTTNKMEMSNGGKTALITGFSGTGSFLEMGTGTNDSLVVLTNGGGASFPRLTLTGNNLTKTAKLGTNVNYFLSDGVNNDLLLKTDSMLLETATHLWTFTERSSQPLVDIDGNFNMTLTNVKAMQIDKTNFNAYYGYQAGMDNTTGVQNCSFGQQALLNNSTGNENTAIGTQSLFACTGSTNTAIGTTALGGNTSGFANTAIGYNAGATITTGAQNTFIGKSADATSGTINNSVAIGYDSRVSTSNTVYLGSRATTFPVQLGLDSCIMINQIPDSVLGSTSGAATFSMPFTGKSYKKVVIYLNALNGSATYTFPTPFTYTPIIINATSAGLVTALSTTSVTVTATSVSRFIILEGY